MCQEIALKAVDFKLLSCKLPALLINALLRGLGLLAMEAGSASGSLYLPGRSQVSRRVVATVSDGICLSKCLAYISSLYACTMASCILKCTCEEMARRCHRYSKSSPELQLLAQVSSKTS